MWVRHALIEPPAEGHKAVERKRFAPLPFARGSCPPFPRKPRQLRRAAGVSVVCEAKSVRSDRDLEPQTHRAQCAPPPTCERGNAFPAKPRAILVRMDIKTRNIATPAADAPATPPASAPAPVVGRFAPSPSGRMHLGNVFSCLCSWLSARSQGGSIVLRIEDLDDRCKRPELAAQLIDDLTWPHLSLFLHACRTPRRERAARQRRHAHLPRRLQRSFC